VKNAVRVGRYWLRVKGKILEEGDIVPCLSARFSVKVPTGDDEEHWEAEKWITGLACCCKDIKNFTTYLNADVTIPAKLTNK